MTHIRDSIHGYIELSDEEKQLLDTSEMQRLRRIRQLGLSSLVYPSATHTRFQHSLGVMHLAGEFAEGLDLDDRRTRELRIAGLLHDSGHGPFSHASEVVAEKHGLSHEDLSCRKVDQLEDSFSVDSERVKKIIRGELEIGQVVAGDIDADRMDYLMRDAHSSGLEHGNIDTATIIRLASIDSRRLVFDEKAIQALESLFTARFHMIRSLYRHHTSNLAEEMLQRALDDFRGNDVEELMRMDDYEAHTALLESGGSSEKLYRRIKDRNLFKRALVWDEDDIPREALQSLADRIDEPEEVERMIADEAGVDPDEVIIDTPEIPGIQEIDVRVKKDGEVEHLSDNSPIINSLEKAEWRMVAMKVYTSEENRQVVEKAASSVLKNYTNVLEGYL